MRRWLLVVTLGFLALVGGAGAGAYLQLDGWLPAEGSAAGGVRVDGRAIPPGADPRAFVEAAAARTLDHAVEIRHDGRSLGAFTLRELGGSADVEWTLSKVMRVARDGSWEDRVLEARRARVVGVDVALPISLPADRLAEILATSKEDSDRKPRAARRPLDGPVVPHQDGMYLDAYATAEAVLLAAKRGEPAALVASFRWTPAATAEAALAADTSAVLASFETRFGGPPGRDRNIARASGQLDGVLLMPGDTISFNELVGPRSEENGFFPAPELYKGEMREGIGGGSCQVASTLYAAAFFGGLEVTQRRNHSRPSGYIRPGLDATVSYPTLDLRIKNPFSFPVVVASKLERGKLRFEVRGKERQATVKLATETAAVLKYTRKLEKAPYLPEGEFRLKQRGKRGLVIRRTKTVVLANGETSVEKSTDTYPATQEIYLVGPKTDESTLPPLEDPDAAAREGA